jgi:hypothetical protein
VPLAISSTALALRLRKRIANRQLTEQKATGQ